MTGAYLSLYAEDRPGLTRGSGAERMCSCPSPGHEDRKPSCSVRLESGQWFCHGCGEGGGVVKWLRLTRGLSGPEALETARRLGLAPETGDARHKSRLNGHRPYRQPGSVENAPPTVLPSRYAACYRYRTPDGAEYARVYRDPAESARPQGRSVHSALCRKTCGNLDPPRPAEPLALPDRVPDWSNPGGDR